MTAHQMIARAGNLPPISLAALELAKRLGRPETHQDDILQALKQDSVLTARLLRACNSSALALKAPVTSIDHAVLMLGHQELFQMVMVLAARAPLSVPLNAYAMENDDLWRHSLLAATAAERVVADGMNFGMDSSTAFTVGLLHDIGKLVLNQYLTREFMVAMRQLIVEGYSVAEAEKAVLGADHAEVGAGLLYVWRLPEPIIEAVALHHRPVARPEPRGSALAWFANYLAHRAAALPPEQNKPMHHDQAQLCEALGLGPKQLEVLLAEVREASAGTNELTMAA